MTPEHAREILARYNARGDFHALTSDQVDGLLVEAAAHKYRKPRNANGSRARYFHAHLRRVAARQD